MACRLPLRCGASSIHCYTLPIHSTALEQIPYGPETVSNRHSENVRQPDSIQTTKTFSDRSKRYQRNQRREVYCNEYVSVCLFCPSVRSHKSKTTSPNFTKFFSVCRLAVAQSSSVGVAICYVFPVLWIASCFHTMGIMVRRVYSWA